jgi:diguanylate cyclase (GGDEF)-like protein/PAS domain S-box-containing protein
MNARILNRRGMKLQLSFRVTLFSVLIFVVCIWSLSFYVTRLLREDMQRLTGEQQFSSVSFMAEQVNAELIERTMAAEVVAAAITPAIMSDQVALQLLLEQRKIFNNLFNGGSSVVGMDGTVIASFPLSAERVGVNYRDRDFIQAALHQGKTFIGEPVIGKKLNAPIFVIATPIRDGDGKTIGGLLGVTNLGLPNFLDKITHSRYGKTGGYLLVDPKKRQIVTAYDKRLIMSDLTPPGRSPVTDSFVNGFEGSGVLVNAVGIEVLASAKGIPVIGWYLAAGLPTEEAFAPIAALQKNVLIAASTLTLLAGGLIWWMVFRQLAPIRIAAHSLSSQLATDKPLESLPVTSRDEIGDLVAGFNRLLESLRQREQDLFITLKSIGDAVIATDAQGRVTRMNPAAERLTGWARSDAIGLPLEQVFHIVNSQTRAPAVNPAQLVMRHGKVVGLANHTALLAKGGAEFQISDSAAPICNADGVIVGVVLVFSDVTEDYLIREALRESEVLFRASFHSAGIGMSIAGLDGQWLQVNQRLCEIVGYSEQELLQKSFQEITHPDDVDLNVLAGQHLLEGRYAFFQKEKRYMHRLGHVVWATLTVSLARDAEGAPRHFIAHIEDISERKKLEFALRQSEAMQRATLEAVPDLLFEMAIDGRFLSFHSARTNDLAQSLTAKAGQLATEVLSAQAATVLLAALKEADRLGQTGGKQIQLDVNDSSSWFELSIARKNAVSDEIACFVVLARDISQRKVAEEQIKQMAFFDTLTGIPNRRLLIDRLQHAMATHARQDRKGALLFVDLDNFKVVNDTLGHSLGDELLKRVAQRLTTCIREGDTVARLGGDEFVVMLENLSAHAIEAASQAQVVGEKILAELSRPHEFDGRDLRSTPSIGITLLGEQVEGIEEPLKRADLAMYQAKAAGRNTLRFYDPKMQAEMNSRSALETRLRTALALAQFQLYYQVQVDAAGAATGAEALLRWNDPQHGVVSPAEFIPLSEETGLILPLGQWVIEAACAQLAAWASQPRMAHLTLSVNISPRQFHQPDFVDLVLSALAHADVNPLRFKLELTEGLLVSDIDDVITKMERLNAAGIGISLDDFGTGYSSLAYLKLLPLEQLKIDQVFVKDILTNPNVAAISKMVIVLADSLGLKVIAEGVESEGQRDFLESQGCKAYQGYLFSRPLAIQDFELMLDKVSRPVM